MGIKVDYDGRKAYKLKESGQYRVENGLQHADEVIIKKNTIVIVDEVYIDLYNPEYIRAFIPSLNTYIISISLFDLENIM